MAVAVTVTVSSTLTGGEIAGTCFLCMHALCTAPFAGFRRLPSSKSPCSHCARGVAVLGLRDPFSFFATEQVHSGLTNKYNISLECIMIDQ